jgi:NAD(P)-dependent dehydrogenase (short-subunit alcohol dehydrogenase family)
MHRVWMITGASRGIGAALRAAVAAGDQVAATARDPSRIDDHMLNSELVEKIVLDVTDEMQAKCATSKVLDRFGRIDVLVNNAGYSFLGAIEECSAEEVEGQFRTNVFGLLNVTRAVLPPMRAQRFGHIINFSSIATLDASPGASTYAASKAAVETLTESLAKECAPFGIRATVILPGHIGTGFQLDSTFFAERRIEDYDSTAGVVKGRIGQTPAACGSDPDRLAEAVRTLVAAAEPPRRFLAGRDALERFERTSGRWDADVERWRSLSASLGGDEGQGN